MNIENVKTTVSKPVTQVLAGVALALLGTTSALAASTWNVDKCPISGTGTGTSCNVNAVAGGNSVTATAYALGGTTASSTFVTATLLQHGVDSGLGVKAPLESETSPQHTMDNSGKTELIAFHFDTAVILDAVTMGWTSSDMDFTLMAYTGVGAPTIVGKTLATLPTPTGATGWSLVTNYGDVDTSSGYVASGTNQTVKVNVPPSNISSSWWLISAYNSGYGAGPLDTLADYMKIMTLASRDPVTPPPTPVPEPGSLTLIGVALMGFVASRRCKKS